MKTDLKALQGRWQIYKIVEVVLFSGLVGLSIGLISTLWWSTGLALFAGLIAGLLTIMIWNWWRPIKLTQERLVQYLDSQFPALEHSSALLFRSETDLGLLEKRIVQQLQQKISSLRFHYPFRYSILLVGVLGVLLAYFSRAEKESPKAATILVSNEFIIPDSIPVHRPFPKLQESNLRIIPPSYTQLPAQTIQGFNAQCPLGSQLEWKLTFSPKPEQVVLQTNTGEKLHFAPHQNHFVAATVLEKNWLYSIQYHFQDSLTASSDFFSIEAIPDSPPKIQLSGLEPYTVLPIVSSIPIPFSLDIQDDYGIKAVKMVATVTVGEGESIQFRDKVIELFRADKRPPKSVALESEISLPSLDMEPGNELYLHIEAIDNSPQAQISKTYKYIIAVEDTTQTSTAMMAGGLPVHRLPEYFRSQRQIIIDTERLIGSKKAYTPTVFQEKSNAIAADQKLLRLRYGRFLGEEFESAIGPDTGTTEEKDEQEEEQDDERKYSFKWSFGYKWVHTHEGEHTHDHDHNPQPKQDTPSQHNHEHKHEHDGDGVRPEDNDKGGIDLEEALAPYAHIHDIMDAETYFDAATTTKLRAALAFMWDAELHLRMGRPEEALPFEYNALKLIKEIQQASRIYVERIGFDPPVINIAEKRLTGDLSKIQERNLNNFIKPEDDYQYIPQALQFIEQIRHSPKNLNAAEGLLLQQAGNELAAALNDQPSNFLRSLNLLRLLKENSIPATSWKEDLKVIQAAFLLALPDPSLQPTTNQRSTRNSLEEHFLHALSND